MRCFHAARVYWPRVHNSRDVARQVGNLHNPAVYLGAEDTGSFHFASAMRNFDAASAGVFLSLTVRVGLVVERTSSSQAAFP